MRTIYTIPLAELSQDDYKKCHSLNARQYGDMRRELSRARRDGRKATITLVKENDVLIGWGLAFSRRNSKYPLAHFYVRRRCRKQGVGRILMENTLRVHPKIIVFPHNDVSGRFFSQYKGKIHTNKFGRGWIK